MRFTHLASAYLLACALVLGACAPSGVVVPATAARATTPAQATTVATTSPAAATTRPTDPPKVVATPSARPPTAAPSAPASAAPTPKAAYCSVGDVLTPDRGFGDHARTYLDWTHALPDTYVPPDLVNATTGGALVAQPFAVEALGAADVRARRGDPAYSTLLSDVPGAALRKIAYADLAAMRAAALSASHRLVILSAYRSYSLQALTFEYWVGVGGYEQALRTSARPGHSEHQLGTAVDFGDGSAAPWEYTDWATTASGAWLFAHAAEYGFVMSYPTGKTSVTCYDYEPWHYRWVGRDLAMRLVGAGVALREYQAGPR